MGAVRRLRMRMMEAKGREDVEPHALLFPVRGRERRRMKCAALLLQSI